MQGTIYRPLGGRDNFRRQRNDINGCFTEPKGQCISEEQIEMAFRRVQNISRGTTKLFCSKILLDHNLHFQKLRFHLFRSKTLGLSEQRLRFKEECKNGSILGLPLQTSRSFNAEFVCGQKAGEKNRLGIGNTFSNQSVTIFAQ
ncbi:hypothetical protein TNCV_1052441 [Trichonephila clavipes]|nr:hypothetical protein TNCV_1052441 [Trichonephila clavipes]